MPVQSGASLACVILTCEWFITHGEQDRGWFELKGQRVRAIRSGGGACGSVRYSLRGEPFRIGICHCADCRKESGSVLVVYGQWRRGDVGSLGKHELESPQLLPDMWVQPFETYPDFIEIIIGSLDEVPSSIGVPERENWTKRREHWLSPIASAEQASEDARDADIVPS